MASTVKGSDGDSISKAVAPVETVAALDKETSSKRTSSENVDVVPVAGDVPRVDLAVCCLTIALYLADYVLDFVMVYKYHRLQERHPKYKIYFWLSLGFCIGPPAIGLVFEIIWHLEEKVAETKRSKSGDREHSAKGHSDWMQSIFAILLLGPVLKLAQSIVYARKSHVLAASDPVESARWRRRCEVERSQAAFLCVIEKFVESSLHLTHQLSLIRNEWRTEHRVHIDGIEWLKVFICLFLMPYMLTVYQSFRRSPEGRTPMKFLSSCVYFVWALLVVTPQAAAMSLFATHLPSFFAVISAAHYLLALVYVSAIAMQSPVPGSRRRIFDFDGFGSNGTGTDDDDDVGNDKAARCLSMAAEGFHRLVVSYLFFFVFVHLEPSAMDDVQSTEPSTRTLYPALIFYALMFIERGLMVSIWHDHCITVGSSDVGCHPTISSFYAMFVSGLAIMVVYYVCFHPTRKPRRKSAKALNA